MNKQELSREELIAVVKELYYNDHKYRRMMSVFRQLNSECKGGVVINLFDSKDEEIRLANALLSEDVFNVQDDKNIKRLIAITEKYGFPGMESLGHDIPIFVIFVHAAPEYFEEVRKLIEKEYKRGNVSEFEKDFIFWHLNGRYRGTGKPQPSIPYSINYRSSIEIFKGSFNYEKDELVQFHKDKSPNKKDLNKQELNGEKLIAAVRDLYFDDQKYRRIIGVFKGLNNKCKGVETNPYNSEDDKTRLAYWLFREDVIEPQDIKNTKQLISITKKYGFPGMERLGHDIPIFMVFAHTPYKYEIFDEVRNLIKQEFKEGRISKYAKDYILWHIEGRMEATPPTVPDTIDYRTNIEIFKGALDDEKESDTNG
ncbi:MAG TPA: hypothetical protein VFM65_07030 [Flavobacteriaceae bacterium]|nr:hypothetical protein [Flavobacteriaceae bacterium]